MPGFSPIKLTEAQADTVAKGVVLVGLGILYYTNAWWPGILLVILAAMLCRFYFLGRLREIIFASIALVALAAISYYDFSGQYIIPLLLILLGAGLIFKELYVNRDHKGP